MLHVDGGIRLPPGGIVVTWPGGGAPAPARVNGKPASWHHGELRITRLPADVVTDRVDRHRRSGGEQSSLATHFAPDLIGHTRRRGEARVNPLGKLGTVNGEKPQLAIKTDTSDLAVTVH